MESDAFILAFPPDKRFGRGAARGRAVLGLLHLGFNELEPVYLGFMINVMHSRIV